MPMWKIFLWSTLEKNSDFLSTLLGRIKPIPGGIFWKCIRKLHQWAFYVTRLVGGCGGRALEPCFESRDTLLYRLQCFVITTNYEWIYFYFAVGLQTVCRNLSMIAMNKTKTWPRHWRSRPRPKNSRPRPRTRPRHCQTSPRTYWLYLAKLYNVG